MSYAETGYRFPIRVFPEAEAARLLAELRRSEALAGGRLDARMNQKPHLLFPWMDQLVRHPAVLDAVEGVIGPNIFCWASQFFQKGAGDAAFVSWHQDGNYWGLSSADVVTAWIALTPSTPLSGNMRVVPGTHLKPMPHNDTFAEQNMLSRGQEIAVAVNEADAVDITLAPGEMSLHHVLIVHGSEPNRAAWPRVGFAVRYVPTHVRQLNGERDSALLVRGEDRFGHFEHELPPEGDLHPAAVARHAAIVDRKLEVLYAGATQAGKRAPVQPVS